MQAIVSYCVEEGNFILVRAGYATSIENNPMR